MADELKRLVRSRRGYRAHLKRLFTTTLELLECCNTTTPDEEDPDTLTELISQLDRKKSILADLDKEIATRINEEELESGVLESELQSEMSRIIMKGKRLQRHLEHWALLQSHRIRIRFLLLVPQKHLFGFCFIVLSL